jgi:hypothetical protein
VEDRKRLRAQERFVTKRFRENWGDRADDVGQGPAASIFQINFDLNDPESQKQSDELARQRSLAIEKPAIEATSSITEPLKDPNPDLN